MKIFKILVAGTLVVILMSLMAGSAFAAQGQITEVNPSGIVNAAAVHDLVDPPGISVVDSITDVVDPPGLMVSPGAKLVKDLTKSPGTQQ